MLHDYSFLVLLISSVDVLTPPVWPLARSGAPPSAPVSLRGKTPVGVLQRFHQTFKMRHHEHIQSEQ